MLGNQAQPFVRDPAALSDIQCPQICQRPRYPSETLVGYRASVQAQATQVEQALGYVQQALVPHSVTEAHVQYGHSGVVFGEVRHSSVRDIVTAPQVQLLQGRNPRQMLESRVRDTRAEAEVDAFEVPQADAQVLEAVVRQLLAVLQAEVLEDQRPLGHVAPGSRQEADSGVRDVPAAAKVKAL